METIIETQPKSTGNGTIDSISDAAGAGADLKKARRRKSTGTATNPDRLPPHSIEAEQGVLGCVLLSPKECLPEVISKLTGTSFYDLRNQTIFYMLAAMHRENQAIDVITVQQRLKDAGTLDQIGGIPYLSQLQDSVPSAANLSYYLDIVREKHELRRMLQTCTDVATRIYDYTGTIDDLKFSVQSDLGDVFSNNHDVGGLVRNLGDIKLPEGDDQNELIRHRFLCRGSGMMIAAPTGVGKSTLAIQAMLCFAIGRECFGFVPTRPLKSVYVQAENDDGDLAELRDGILKGLKFTEQERQQAVANVQCLTVDDKSGVDFLHKIVEPACRDQKPDLLWIDPLFTFTGGDTRQETVSPWLRNHLNPILHRYAVAAVIIHHTNKPPTGKEKNSWQAGDFAYLGSGTSELGNWPRCVVGIRSLGSHTVFELVLGKRGARAHWRNEDGETSYSRYISHGDDGIYWRDAREDEIPAKGGRRATNTVDDILEVLGKGEMTAKEWQEQCESESGIKRATFYTLKKTAVERRLVSQSPISKKWLRNP